MPLGAALAQPPPPPPFTKELYPIATIGTDTCGKTALTRKWADPTLTIATVSTYVAASMVSPGSPERALS